MCRSYSSRLTSGGRGLAVVFLCLSLSSSVVGASPSTAAAGPAELPAETSARAGSAGSCAHAELPAAAPGVPSASSVLVAACVGTLAGLVAHSGSASLVPWPLAQSSQYTPWSLTRSTQRV